MNLKDLRNEGLATLLVLAVLIAIPVGVWGYQYRLVHADLPEDAVVIQLYGSANGGIWSTQPVVGWNYWWKSFPREQAVRLPSGRPVRIRVTSTDVLHSFAMPSERKYRRPVDVAPGHWVTLTLEPREADEVIPFLCWQWCSPDHEQMHGEMVVVPTREDVVVTAASSTGNPQ